MFRAIITIVGNILTVKEYDHYLHKQQVCNQNKIWLRLTEYILNTSIYPLQDRISLKCCSPSDNGHHWPKYVRVLFYF
jgi:hypothetical protein